MRFLLLLVFCLGCGSDDSSLEQDPIAESIPAATITPTRFVGVSGFAAMHPGFPCERWLEPYRRARLANPNFGAAAAILWGTFEDFTPASIDCTKRFTQLFSNIEHVLEIHFSNGACRRNERCDVGEFLRNLDVNEYNRALERNEIDAAVAFRLAQIFDFIAQVAGPNTQVIISRGLEENLTDRAAASFTRIFRSVTPLDLVVSSNAGSNIGADLRETHDIRNSIPAPCLANQDGAFNQSLDDSQAFIKVHAACSILFFWPESLQGICEGCSFVTPRNRIFTISDQQISDYAALLIEASNE